MLEFLRRNRLLATAAFFLVLAAGLILRTGSTRGRDDQLGRLFLELMAPLDRAATFVSRTVADAWQGATALMRARDEAEALRGRVRQLERDTARLAEAEAENARLRTLLDFRKTLSGALLTARVIGHDAAGLSRTLVIDQGSAAGIAKGAAVLAPEGIVGQVFLVSPQPESHAAGLASRCDAPLRFLRDRDNRAAAVLGIVERHGVPAGMQLLGYDTDAPRPTVFITAPGGRVVYCDVTDNYRVRPEPAQYFAVLDRLALA